MSGYHNDAFGGNPTNRNYSPDKAKQRMERILVLSKIGAAILLVILFVGFGLITDKNNKNSKTEENIGQETSKQSYSNKECFTLGSTTQRVIDVMGEPNQYNSYSLEYGHSSIYLNENGIVVGWNNINNELKVFLAKPDNNAPLIRKGSTRSDVIKSMGTPSFINKNIWRYEKSYILFNSKGKVTNWKDISNVLKIAN